MDQAIITPETVQRWQAALDRAINAALDVLITTTGEAYVESSSTPGLIYAVSRESCDCPAGQVGHICLHRACYLAQIGELLPPVADVAEIRCKRCGGHGAYWAGSVDDERNPMRHISCPICSGVGYLTAAQWAAEIALMAGDTIWDAA
jgi:hypothetical protein